WSSVLPYSIGSVLAQTYTDFELLVIGDGCTDDSEQVVGKIADPRVRWIGIARTGHQSGPNNEGLRQARGEWIAYLGHDDLWLPHHLEVLTTALARGGDAVHSLVALVPPNDGDITISVSRWRPPSTLLHRRDVVLNSGGWRDFRELRVTPEEELLQRIEAAGGRIEPVPRLTVLKFPASWRRRVYRERPSHEQAHWLARIRSEPDFEVVQLASFVARRKPAFTERALRLLTKPSLWFSFLWRRKGARIRAWQRYKGIE
ncbi:MAG TPA: glycosyltransferase family A protein, partial [Thermoanaerobaculia bacterium]